MLSFIVLLACAPDTEAEPPPSDTAGPDTAPDSGSDSGGDTPPALALTWPTTIAAPDFRVDGCGSTEDMGKAIASDGDLDGDGLGELAMGAPGHDELGVDIGAVYVFLGSELSGSVDVTDAHAVIRSQTEGAMPYERFGDGVEWLGDLDGDGLSELLVRRGTMTAFVFEGRVLAAGGEFVDRDAAAAHEREDLSIVPYPDLDGDGLDDVALGLPYKGMGVGVGYRGTVALASGLALLDPALPTLREVYGLATAAHAGEGLATIEDGDGDGWPDLATSLGGDLVTLGSAAVLSPYTQYVDDAVTARWSAYGAVRTILNLGDVDGGGLADLALYSGSQVLGVRMEDAGGDLSLAPAVDCGGSCKYAVPAEDLDGDGFGDLWVVSGNAHAIGAADLVAGTADYSNPLATVISQTSATGITVNDGPLGLWVGLDAYYTLGGGAARVHVGLGDTVDVTAADATVTTAWAGWQVDEPAFVDLTGDGIDELVFEDEDAAGIAVFDGTRVAAGGRTTLCDADWRVDRDQEVLAWLDDSDGDGASEVLLADNVHRGASTLSVRGGRALLGLDADDTRVVREATISDGSWYLVPMCDVTGDGRVDFAEYDGGDVDILDGRAWSDGYDEATHLLGRLGGDVDYPIYACFDDLDGDGAEEVNIGFDIWLSTTLDPATVFTYGDGWTHLERIGEASGHFFASYATPLGDLDGDGLPEHAFGTATDTDVGDDVERAIRLVDGTTLAAGGTVDADDFPAALTMAGESGTYLYPLGAVDFDGDGLLDQIVLWSASPGGDFSLLGVSATDLLSGAGVAAPDATMLFRASGTGFDGDGFSLGPDYGGVGGVSVVVVTEADYSGHRTVRIMFAR